MGVTKDMALLLPPMLPIILGARGLAHQRPQGQREQSHPQEGRVAARQVATQFVAALWQCHQLPPSLTDLEGLTPEMLADPEVTRQVDKIMEHFSREDDNRS